MRLPGECRLQLPAPGILNVSCAVTEGTGVSAMHLLPLAGSSSAVRHRMCDELADGAVPAEIVDDAALVMAELVSNALLHADPLPDGHLQARWRQRPGQLELSVSDGGGSSRPTQQSAGLAAPGGRGLAIVDALTTEWGVQEDAGVVTVWAVLPLTGEK